MLNRFKHLSTFLSHSPLSQLSVLLLVATVTVLQLGHFSADAEEHSRIPLQLQRLTLERQQHELLDQGVVSELVNLRAGNFAIWIKPEGTSKENRLASHLKKKLGVSLYISPETIHSSVAAFSLPDKSIYLSDRTVLDEDFELLLHEVRHAQFKKQITSTQNDMFHGNITRNVVYEHSNRLSYFKKGMTLEENFSLPYELRLNMKKAFAHPAKTAEIIKTGMEINEFTIQVLTELFNEVSFDVSKVALGMVPASELGGSSKDQIAAYIIQGKNFKLKSFISGADERDSQQQLVDALKQSLKRKIDYYTQARDHWKKVKASFDSKNTEAFSRDVLELISGAREHLQPPCVATRLKASLQ